MEYLINKPFSYTFTSPDDVPVQIKIGGTKTNNGYCITIKGIENGDTLLFDLFITNMGQFKKFQDWYWFTFGHPLVWVLLSSGVISEDEMMDNQNHFFFPPYTADRKDWDYTEFEGNGVRFRVKNK